MDFRGKIKLTIIVDMKDSFYYFYFFYQLNLILCFPLLLDSLFCIVVYNLFFLPYIRACTQLLEI